MRHAYRFAFAAFVASSAALISTPVRANGRFPAADQLVIDPSDPTHIVVRTTFGFIESRDAGKTWLWTCEEIIGKIANQDPPFAVTGDGSVIVAVPFEGVSITHDHGCNWEKAPEPLLGQLAVDVTSEPSDPAGLVVVTSTNDTNPDAGPTAPQEFRNLIVETKDNGHSWSLLGEPLARDLIAATIEIPKSDAQRIYVSGVVGDPRLGALERSEDGGKTWKRAIVPTAAEFGSVYISAIDPQNPDRIFVRVTGLPDSATGATPTTLLVSADKGDHWTELAKTEESMLGFALSPDGARVAYGTLGEGVLIGPSDGSSAFATLTSAQNRCLTWSAAGLYACGTDLGRESTSTFAIALSPDVSATFNTLFRLYQTCPTTCPDNGRFNNVCRTTWETKPGVTVATGATGETCTVEWAKGAAPDGGATVDASGGSGGAGAGGASAGGAGGGAGSAGTSPPTNDGCSCRTVGHASSRTGAWALGIAGAAVAWFRRRQKSARVAR
jgi:MYXO-CTERM domain-containing protein